MALEICFSLFYPWRNRMETSSSFSFVFLLFSLYSVILRVGLAFIVEESKRQYSKALPSILAASLHSYNIRNLFHKTFRLLIRQKKEKEIEIKNKNKNKSNPFRLLIQQKKRAKNISIGIYCVWWEINNIIFKFVPFYDENGNIYKRINMKFSRFKIEMHYMTI